ncbi:MAG: 3-deoxy-8-phosphooctulonate synthase [Planctomycetota bacterium]
MSARLAEVRGIEVGAERPLVIIAGPCVIESEAIVRNIARQLRDLTASLRLPLIFKASFDKANRNSLKSYRGPGLKEGLPVLKGVGEEFGLALVTDIHEPWQAAEASAVVDLVQIPAFLCRQTDLVVEAARHARALNIKKGQFLSPEQMGPIADKARAAGARNILLTDRGVTFGYGDLIADMRAIPRLQKLGYPVVFDATHSVQKPGGLGEQSGGEGHLAPTLARAAVAAGADAVFMEVHETPEQALSDGPNMIRLSALPELLTTLKTLRELCGRFAP